MTAAVGSARFVPASLRGYKRSWLRTDILAGVTLAAVAIPETMGYTSIAQVPVVTGLYTVIFPALAFALLGSSRLLVVGADSATAAILAAGLAGTALGMIATGVLQTAPDAAAVRDRVRQVSLTDQFALSTSAWPWIYAVAGGVVLLGAVLLWIGAARWAERSDRFTRTTERAGGPVDLNEDPNRAWKDLDAGRDPTGDPEVPDPDMTDPDVHDGAGSVTMGQIHDPRQE